MSAGWSARLQRVLVLGVAASMLSVGSGFAQQQPGGTPPPGGAEPGVPPGTQQENPPDTRPGPPFELEAGYALTNVARNIQGIVVGVAADPSGNVYYVTNTCPTVDREAFTAQRTMQDAYNGLSTFGYSQLVRIAPDGSQTVLLNEQQGQLKCSVNGLTYHNGKLYLPVMGQMIEYDVASQASKVILDNLPWGDHYVDRVTFGPDGKGYFGIGTASGTTAIDDGSMSAFTTSWSSTRFSPPTLYPRRSKPKPAQVRRPSSPSSSSHVSILLNSLKSIIRKKVSCGVVGRSSR